MDDLPSKNGRFPVHKLQHITSQYITLPKGRGGILGFPCVHQ